MKKRIFICVLTLVVVLAMATTALADSASYNVSMQSYYDTRSITRINDTRFWDHNTSATDLAGRVNVYYGSNVKFYVNNENRTYAMGREKAYTGYHGPHYIWEHSGRGKAWIYLENCYYTGGKVRLIGALYSNQET